MVLCQLHAQPGAADIPKECAGDGAACQGARSCWEPDGKALHCSQWWHCPFSRSPNNFQSWLRALVTVLPQRSLASPPDLQDLQDMGPPLLTGCPTGALSLQPPLWLEQELDALSAIHRARLRMCDHLSPVFFP